jgi:hypothetical protein
MTALTPEHRHAAHNGDSFNDTAPMVVIPTEGLRSSPKSRDLGGGKNSLGTHRGFARGDSSTPYITDMLRKALAVWFLQLVAIVCLGGLRDAFLQPLIGELREASEGVIRSCPFQPR